MVTNITLLMGALALAISSLLGWRVLEAFDARPDRTLSEAQVRKICWDNPSRLYGIA